MTLRTLVALWLACFISFFSTGSTASAQAKRPLVFIPGILGSQLCDSAGHLVWGKAGSLWNLDRLEITPSGPVEKLTSCGPLTTVVSLGPFWQQDIYTPLLEAMKKEWGSVEGETLFVWLISGFGVMADCHATRATMSAPRRAFPRRRVLWTNWKKPR
jgi:hypothetical protein